jgi:chromosome segregation ATPase
MASFPFLAVFERKGMKKANSEHWHDIMGSTLQVEVWCMDAQQIGRMIEWLDEERRRDKATIATLEERLAQQQQTIDTLTKRLTSMESDQSLSRAQVGNGASNPDLLEQFRRELQQTVESIESKRLNAEREIERRAELSREPLSRQLRELADKMNRYDRQATELPAMTAERDRVQGAVAGLQQRADDLTKRLEEPERRITLLEEQRRQDARRISDIDNELPDLRKAIDQIRPKLALIEDLSLRNERKVQDVTNGDRERREQIQQFIDQQTLLLQQRDAQIADFVKRFGEQDNVMQRNIERFETWAEAYREMRRVIDDFERIGDRLERRINEVAEMQRLSENRFREEWNEWGENDQKRWKQFTLSNDEVWRLHDKEFERFVQRVAEIEGSLAPLSDSLSRLWSLERERAQLYRERYQALLLEYDNAAAPVRTAPVTNGTNGS